MTSETQEHEDFGAGEWTHSGPSDGEPIFHSILLPIDGSARSSYAALMGMKIAKASHARVTIFTTLDSAYSAAGYPGHDGLYYTEYRNSIKKVVTDIIKNAKRLAAEVGISGRAVVALADDPSYEIISRSKRDHDLIVLSTHGRSGASRLLMGSITEQVMRNAPIPVLIFRIKEDSEAEQMSQALLNFKRILVCIDGTESSIEACNHGLRLASFLKCAITFLHIIPSKSLGLDNTKHADAIKTKIAAVGDNALKQCSKFAADAGVTCDVLQMAGDPAESILAVEKSGYDLVVTGTHGHSGLSRAIHGSVSETVLRSTTVPLYVFKCHPKESDDVQNAEKPLLNEVV